MNDAQNTKDTETTPIETVFDFKDCKGPVPAHRHPNGGGWVADSATVDETAYVGEYAKVYGNAMVYGDAQVYGNAGVYGDAHVFGNAVVSGEAQICDRAKVCGYVHVFGNAVVSGDSQIYGKAKICDDAQVSGYARVCDNAVVERIGDYFTIGGHAWRVTYTKSDDCLTIGCQRHPVSVWSGRGWTGDRGEYCAHLAGILSKFFPA